MEHSCEYQSGKTEELGAEGKEGERWQLDSMAVGEGGRAMAARLHGCRSEVGWWICSYIW